MARTSWLVVAALMLVAGAATFGRLGHASPSVAFASPRDGATVSSPVSLRMTAHGITIEPAGPIHRNSGHFHVLVDIGCFHPGAFVEMHTVGFEHFGDGSTFGQLDLPPGRHTLCLQVGDGAHVTTSASDEITINVR